MSSEVTPAFVEMIALTLAIHRLKFMLYITTDPAEGKLETQKVSETVGPIAENGVVYSADPHKIRP